MAWDTRWTCHCGIRLLLDSSLCRKTYVRLVTVALDVCRTCQCGIRHMLDRQHVYHHRHLLWRWVLWSRAANMWQMWLLSVTVQCGRCDGCLCFCQVADVTAVSAFVWSTFRTRGGGHTSNGFLSYSVIRDIAWVWKGLFRFFRFRRDAFAVIVSLQSGENLSAEDKRVLR